MSNTKLSTAVTPATKIEIKNSKLKAIIGAIGAILFGLLLGSGVTLSLKTTEEEIVEVEIEPTFQIEFADEQIPAYVYDDKGGVVEDENIPTVEFVDGGNFEDVNIGLSAIVPEGVYTDLGAIEPVDTSTADTFLASTLGKCYIANNIFGAQCVSYARVFWWSYAKRDVSTCGTGLAKGMMNCWEQNAGDEFETIWKTETDKIIDGTILVFDGPTTGHVAFAAGPVVNGYIVIQGQNQGGKSCGSNVGGSATNRVNISLKNFLGGYIPKAYLPKKPEPQPLAPDTGRL